MTSQPRLMPESVIARVPRSYSFLLQARLAKDLARVILWLRTMATKKLGSGCWQNPTNCAVSGTLSGPIPAAQAQLELYRLDTRAACGVAGGSSL